MKKLSFLFFFISTLGFSQNLEEQIYVATETFISNPNETTFLILETKEATFKTQIKTKNEQLAFIFLQSHKGYYLHEQSELNKAITTYENALKRFNENKLSTLSDFDIIENCLKPLGNLYTKTDDFTNALNTINQYIYLADKNKNRPHYISGLINLSTLYYTLGDHQSAIKTVDDALKSLNISKIQKIHLIDIKTASLVASSVNNSTLASIIEKEENNYTIELKKGNFNKALTAFKNYKTHELKRVLTDRELSQLHIEEGQIHFLLNQLDEAIINLKQAIKILLPNFKTDGLPNKNELYAENKFIDIFDLYAEIEVNSERALQSFDLSFYVARLLRENWTSQETKTRNEIENRNRSEKCITILFDAFKQTKNKTFLNRAFQYSENHKASVLTDIAQKRLRLQKHPNDSLLVKEFELLKEQEHITNLLIEESLAANRSSKINDLSEQLSRVSLQLKALNTIISKKYSNTNNSFSLNELQQKLLKNNAVLTEYFYGKNYLYQFIISDNDIDLKQMPLNDTSKKAITKFNHLFDNPSIINNNINNYTQQAFNIYELLNFKSLQSYKNVIIIPDGVLNFTPFEALLSTKTETTTYSKMPFVILNQNIAYSTNVFFYLNTVESNKKNKVLGVFPVFKNTQQTLTFSINEAEVIENEMASRIFMNADASKSNFIKNASNYNILHLSTHATSGDFVKPASISFYDDNLTLNELYSIDLNADLVVLSACETGIGKLHKAEGAMSVARGFQFAGAKNLLFSLWQINDLSTSKIMEFFYENYKSTQSAFTANHHSKIAYLQNKSISNAKKSPYYWSAFVYYGELSNPIPNNTSFYIFFGILIALIIVLLILKLKKT
ncbi:MAG: CHAT domain-containing protein [Algibacter sp.]